MQNGYIESFNGKFRDECLERALVPDLHQARTEIAIWRRDYNEVRPPQQHWADPTSALRRAASPACRRCCSITFTPTTRSSNLQPGLPQAVRPTPNKRGVAQPCCLRTACPLIKAFVQGSVTPNVTISPELPKSTSSLQTRL
jgi:hypothetical protein